MEHDEEGDAKKSPGIPIEGIVEGDLLITNKKLINKKARAFYEPLLFDESVVEMTEKWKDFANSKVYTSNNVEAPKFVSKISGK